MPEWRKIAAFPKLYLLLEITGEIVMPRELDRRTEGRVGLHENFARRFTTSRASRDLREQLERSFAGAEIGQMKRQIGIDNSDERYIWKVQTFRDHLRADENIDFSGAKGTQRFAIGILARHGIGVHSPNDCLGEQMRDSRFHFLGAEAGIDQRVLTASRTFLRHRCAVTAKMTAQPCMIAMKSERDAAIRAIARFPAIAAEQGGGKSAPI